MGLRGEESRGKLQSVCGSQVVDSKESLGRFSDFLARFDLMPPGL
jgi:hypothetical protein